MYLFSSSNNLSISTSLGDFILSKNNLNSSLSLSALFKGSIIFVDFVVLSGGANVLALLSLFLHSEAL